MAVRYHQPLRTNNQDTQGWEGCLVDKKFKRLLRLLQKEGGSRISTEAMPNGFFFNDLLWFGDGGSQETAVSRGFVVIPGERDGMDDEAASDLIDRLRVMLATLGEGYSIQARYLVCS